MDSNETKRLIYFWKYVKKNLILFSVVDHVKGIFEDQCIERFEQFHKQVEKTARANFRDRTLLEISLTNNMAYMMNSTGLKSPE